MFFFFSSQWWSESGGDSTYCLAPKLLLKLILEGAGKGPEIRGFSEFLRVFFGNFSSFQTDFPALISLARRVQRLRITENDN